jgi:signal transduction histidine kinase
VRLRGRLALITVAIALVLAGVVVLGYRELSRRTSDELIAALVRSDASGVNCVGAQPRARHLSVVLPAGGPRSSGERRVELDIELHADATSLREQAPQLLALLEGGASLAARPLDAARRELVIALPEPGSCTLARVRAPSLRPSLPPPLVIGPLVVALLAVLIGLGPLVRRARSLSLAVRRWQQQPEGAPLPEPDQGRDELGELSRAYHAAAQTVRDQHDELRVREQALREFVENVSHDLATPLTVLRGHLALAALGGGEQAEALRLAMVEAHHVGDLLGSLALSAKLEGGTPSDARFDLSAALRRVCERHHVIARELGLSLEHFEGDDPLVVRGDVTFAEQALDNLVGNALRHHDRRAGHVAVLLEREPAHFVVSIIDDGPGLDDEELVRVRRRGERGDRARGRSRGGMGLGLSIVERVAALHGWTFTLQRGERGVGLVARLRGPLESSEPDQPATM